MHCNLESPCLLIVCMPKDRLVHSCFFLLSLLVDIVVCTPVWATGGLRGNATPGMQTHLLECITACKCCRGQGSSLPNEHCQQQTNRQELVQEKLLDRVDESFVCCSLTATSGATSHCMTVPQSDCLLLQLKLCWFCHFADRETNLTGCRAFAGPGEE